MGLLGLGVVGVAAGVVVGCRGPMDRDADLALREQLITEYRTRMTSIADAGVVQVTRDPSEVEAKLSDQRRRELDAMSGVSAYADDPLDLGSDLLGRADAEAEAVALSLEDAIRMTVQNNLDVRTARLSPAISRAQVVAAEAAFDAVFFTNAQWAKLDTPQPAGAIPGLSGDTQSENFQLNTGLTKPLTTGGAVTLENTITRDERVPSFIGVNSYYDNDVALSLNQPLLRGFGVDVNTAQIVLAENARDRDVEALRQEMIDRVRDAEAAYWELSLARQQLLIQTRLLQRTIEDRDRLEKRAEFDAAPVQVTEANSFVELRRGDVIRARQAVRDASDRLKRLINSDELPVAGETLLMPTDAPGESAVELSLLDAVTTAIRRRPELQSALLSINDATVRQRVADNARLPLLDLGASVVYSGLDIDRPEAAFGNSFEGEFIDYLLSANFEQPIGNRAAEADYTAARLQRRQAVLNYQNVAQVVVLEVKQAMRSIRTAYELIGATRAARRAAADNLRALQVQENEGAALTPEFINLKLQSQERLATAELQEAQALVDYANALTALDRATGSLLERNNIVFDAE